MIFIVKPSIVVVLFVLKAIKLAYSFEQKRFYPHAVVTLICASYAMYILRYYNMDFVGFFSGFPCSQDVQALGFFELQMLEIENYRGQLATGECCGSGGSSSVVAPQQPSPSSTAKPSVPLQCVGAPQCNTLFQLCLREYQNQAAVSATAAVAANGRMNGGDDDSMVSMVAFNHQQHYAYMHHCSFGNVTTPVLGGNSFTMGGDATASSDSTAPLDSNNRGTAVGNLALPFSFSWTVSTQYYSDIYIYFFFTKSLFYS